MGETLLDLKLSNGYTVRQYLGRIALGKGYELCASHTLAPALVAMFQIDLGFDEKRSFKDCYSHFVRRLEIQGMKLLGPNRVGLRKLRERREEDKEKSKSLVYFKRPPIDASFRWYHQNVGG
jgi:hypothetical protein